MDGSLQLTTRCGMTQLLFGEAVPALATAAAGRRTIILADEKVLSLYAPLFEGHEIIAVPEGEGAKSLGRATLIYQELLRRGADRETLLVALGGGVVTDLGGFVAATFLRGLPCGFIPTTLLAQVDAAIGGKNGVNLGEYKNMVGTIRQPAFVIIDPAFLATLPRREFISGLAEVVKYGLISDPVILDLLEGKTADEVALDTPRLEELIDRSVRAKVRVVEEDAEEKGLRRILNFGHTVGHGIERLYDLPHGQAVAFGMKVALHLSVARRLLDEDTRSRALHIMRTLEMIPDVEPEAGRVLEIIGHDKKRAGEKLHFILLRAAGRPEIVPLTLEEIGGALEEVLAGERS